MKVMRVLQVILLLMMVLLLHSCGNKKVIDKKAAAIVAKCIEAHGGENYKNMDVSFDFRDYRVRLQQDASSYRYERTTTDSAGNKRQDLLYNGTFERRLNGKLQQLSAADALKYEEAINALAYFALLPYKLSEPAANLQFLEETSIDNKPYAKIAVSFDKEGGGRDYHDEFCYWINLDNYTMDYLAYASGGPRFRKAVKSTKVGGVVFQDYENYEVLDTTIATSKYDAEFIAQRVKLLSVIEQIGYRSNK